LIETRHQRSAERIMVAKASFIVAFSLMSLGMILGFEPVTSALSRLSRQIADQLR
jgi:hypothetical protein